MVLSVEMGSQVFAPADQISQPANRIHNQANENGRLTNAMTQEEGYFSNYPYVNKIVVLQQEAKLCEVPNDINFRKFRKIVLEHNSCA